MDVVVDTLMNLLLFFIPLEWEIPSIYTPRQVATSHPIISDFSLFEAYAATLIVRGLCSHAHCLMNSQRQSMAGSSCLLALWQRKEYCPATEGVLSGNGRSVVQRLVVLVSVTFF